MKRKMRDTLCFRVNDRTYEVVNQLAEKNERAVAEVARDLILAGLVAQGIECQ
jgi:predicted DNA-binding protein